MSEKKRWHRHTRGQGQSMRARVWKLVLTDLFFVILGLNIFALFHHVIRFAPESAPVQLPSAAETESSMVSPPSPEAPEAEDMPTETESPRVYSGVWGEKFAEHFTEGEIIQTETVYRSENIALELTRVSGDGVIYHVVDIYISDLKYLRTGLANDAFWSGSQPILTMAQENKALAAISGDHCSARREGVVVRNGILYRDSRFADVCVLDYDGVMYTVTDEELDLDALIARGAYQVWSFGPMLLQDGKAMTEFNSEVRRANPRSAIGYYEPGHYCFVQVDGRIDESHGMTLAALSQLFEDLGCQSAYNLDGGRSAGLVWMGELQSYPYGRNVSDIIYVAELPDQANSESTEES